MKKFYFTGKLSYIKTNALSVLLIASSSLFAQDIHFSQYLQTPTLVNPALTGSAYTLRAAVIYKDQWKGVTVPYKTYGASVEMRLKASNWEKSDPNKKAYKKSVSRLAGGLSFFSDKAGDGNMGISQVSFSLASFVPVSDKNSLSLGLQTSFVQRKIDFSKLIFPEQYNGTTYDPTMYNGENPSTQSYSYPDVAAGVNWSYGYTQKAIGTSSSSIKANAGLAVYHLNKPRQKYLASSNDQLYMKVVLHGDATISVKSTNMAIIPSYLMEFQGPSKEILMGVMTKFYFREDSKYTGIIKQSAFGIGAAYRNRDALIVSAQIEFGQYAIGFSYDVNTSNLRKASLGRGGPEIFIRFVTPNPFLYHLSNTKARYNLN